MKGPSLGVKLYEEKGCNACHTTDGSPRVGPTFKGLLGKTETVLRGGKEVTVLVDENYIRYYILHPNVDVIKGFPPVMPQVKLTDEEINALIEFIKGLK